MHQRIYACTLSHTYTDRHKHAHKHAHTHTHAFPSTVGNQALPHQRVPSLGERDVHKAALQDTQCALRVGALHEENKEVLEHQRVQEVKAGVCVFLSVCQRVCVRVCVFVRAWVCMC